MSRIIVDAWKMPRVRALESQLRGLRREGNHDRASVCADLILELVGLRPCPLPAVIAVTTPTAA